MLEVLNSSAVAIMCALYFQFPAAQLDIPSIYFYSQHGVVVEEINGPAILLICFQKIAWSNKKNF